MRKSVIILNLLLTLFAFSCSQTPQQIKWMSFNEGMKEAKISGKPVMIDFYADWCVWCKIMDAKTFSQKEVITKINDSVVAIRIHTDREENIVFDNRTFSSSELMQAMGIAGLPTLVFLNSDGSFIDKIPGYTETSAMLSLLDNLKKKIKSN